jgi:3-phosphoshikimate 1-carboxyvinyltransferase
MNRLFRIEKSRLQGKIVVPSSKSHTMRAILFALMASGASRIYHYLHSPDTDAMIEAISHWGARVSVSPTVLEIEGVHGQLKPAENIIQANNSGIIYRFCTAMAALLSSYTVITGDHSIRHRRPIQPLLDALQQLGAHAVSTRGNGFAPILVRGPLQGGRACLNGEDSQLISALLIACSFLKKPTQLFVENPGEKPWIDLTLFWLKKLGIDIAQHDYQEYHIPGHAAYEGFTFHVPGDLSSASYPIAAAVITGSELTLQNVDLTDRQGDKKFIAILMQMGARIDIDAVNHCLTIRRGSELNGVHVDMNDCIDMITILAVVACFAKGQTQITGAAIARNKECDRLRAITTELRKMGADIEEYAEGLIIQPSFLSGASVRSYCDHRIALSLSVAAMAAYGESVIEDVDCIAKTYSTFSSDLNAVGARIY